MELKDKAREYAINVLEEQIAKVAQAYSDGYMQAYKEIAALPVEEDGVTYEDLGLPSGTLWSRDIITTNDPFDSHLCLPHAKAQVLNVPTKTQIDELFSICKIVTCNNDRIEVTGPNGNKICLPKHFFWIKDCNVVDYKAMAFNPCKNEYIESYTGYSINVVLVK